MAVPQHVQRVGAHSNQETWPCDSSSPGPTVAPDSQPPLTGRKRKERTLSPEQLDSQKVQPKYKYRRKRRRGSDSSWDRAEQRYWDSLSKVWLAPDALKELDRRNALLAAKPPHQVCKSEHQVLPRDIVQFARHGGPDLSDIRQYLEPSGSMPSRGGKKSLGQGTVADTEKTPRVSAYSPNFAQILADNGVFQASRSHRAANHHDWNEVLIQPRPSLSPSRMSDGHYDRFVKAIEGAETEAEVMSNVFPKIVGNPRYPSRQNVPLGNLDPIAEGIVVPQPDYYEGDIPRRGNRQLRRQLESSIVPSSRTSYPFLPNLFVEAKGPDGSLAVAKRQASHDGSLGARAMHRVENLGRRREVFDNKARTASAILHGEGSLALFSHHLSQPMGRGTPSETFMTPLRSFDLADSPSSFRQGVGALRNASDYTHQHRTSSIQNAHRRSGIVTPELSRIGSRPTLTPLSCQTPTSESSDSGSNSSSEDESDDDDDYYEALSKVPPKRKVVKPKVVTATPKRLARRDPSPPRRELRPRRGSRRA